MKNLYLFASMVSILLFAACSKPNKPSATLLIHGGPIYTVDSTQTIVEAVATSGDTILFAGTLAEAEAIQNRTNTGHRFKR